MASRRKSSGGIVYSTEQGRMCPECGQPVAGCTCSQRAAPPRGDGIVRVGRETKGRRGKGVTVITGLGLDGAGLSALAKQFKQRCGSGGTVKEGVIEIQGDHRDVLVQELEKQGYTVRRSGG